MKILNSVQGPSAARDGLIPCSVVARELVWRERIRPVPADGALKDTLDMPREKLFHARARQGPRLLFRSAAFGAMRCGAATRRRCSPSLTPSSCSRCCSNGTSMDGHSNSSATTVFRDAVLFILDCLVVCRVSDARRLRQASVGEPAAPRQEGVEARADLFGLRDGRGGGVYWRQPVGQSSVRVWPSTTTTASRSATRRISVESILRSA